MNSDDLDQVLADFAALDPAGLEPTLESIKTALMLEDVFGVSLTDGDIDASHLADRVAIKRLLDRKTER